MMYGLPSVIGSVAQMMAFKGIGKELNKLTILYANHPCLIPTNVEDMYSSVWWRVVIMNLWTLPIIISWFVWAKFYMYPEEISTLVSWIWAIGAIFIAYYFFLLPTSSGGKQTVGKNVCKEISIQLFSHNGIGLILPGTD